MSGKRKWIRILSAALALCMLAGSMTLAEKLISDAVAEDVSEAAAITEGAPEAGGDGAGAPEQGSDGPAEEAGASADGNEASPNGAGASAAGDAELNVAAPGQTADGAASTETELNVVAPGQTAGDAASTDTEANVVEPGQEGSAEGGNSDAGEAADEADKTDVPEAGDALDESSEADTEALPLSGDAVAQSEEDGSLPLDEACSHENCYLSGDYEIISGEYCDIDEMGHTFVGEVARECYCPDCGAKWFDESTKQTYTVRGAHSSGDEGRCEDCGYAFNCAHENTYISFIQNESGTLNYAPIDGDRHAVSGKCTAYLECDSCGAGFYDEVELTDYKEQHSFNGEGVCSDCGYRREEQEGGSSCQHESGEVDYISFYATAYAGEADATGHLAIGYTTAYSFCPDCGTEYSVTETDVTQWEAHRYGESGACTLCGYENTCAHLNLEREPEIIFGDGTYIVHRNAKTHTVVGYYEEWYRCMDCGEYMEALPRVCYGAVTEEHHFDRSGVCIECDYERTPCEHANAETSEVYLYPKYECIDVSTHRVEGYRTIAHACPDCGASWNEYPGVNKTSAVENHNFVDGACADCGYVAETTSPEPTAPTATDEPLATATPEPTAPAATDEPLATATPEPTMPVVTDEPLATATPEPTASAATDEPIATPTPDAEMNQAEDSDAGERADEAQSAEDGEQTIAETMIAVAEALSEEGAADVKIVDAEQILTQAEVEALDALPLRDKLLTFLSVIGFEDSVNRTLDAAQLRLSDDALALKGQIQARIAEMDAEARAQFDAALEAHFPREAREVDGAACEFFALELEIREGEALRRERYSFRSEGGEWLYAQREIIG